MAKRTRPADSRQLGLFEQPAPVSVRGQSVAPRAHGAAARTSEPPPPAPRRLSNLPAEILRPPAAAAALAISQSLLKKWRASGEGPRFIRLGTRAIGYRRADLEAWVDGRLA